MAPQRWYCDCLSDAAALYSWQNWPSQRWLNMGINAWRRFAGTPDWVLLLIGAIICTAVLGYLAFLLITSLTQALWGRILEPVLLAILIGTMWMRVFRSWRR
jgi:hypothetical protein